LTVRYLLVEQGDDVGQRIDNFLIRALKGVPKQKVYSILRRGEVRVNGKRIKPTYRLALNDRLRIPPLETREHAAVRFSEQTAVQLEDAIVYEDSDLLVLNKPFGFAVHGGSSITAGVVEMMRTMRNLPRLELAHRLDRDTSGCLLICKKRSVLKEAQAAFRERRVKKKYELIVQGCWDVKCKTVQLRLHRYKTDWGERRVRVDDAGKVARTDFEIRERAARATLLEASLHTGRTHQIRVHTQSQKHPILGDDKYAFPSSPAAARLCLHAKRLVVPLGDDKLDVEAPMELSMQAIWREYAG
tara:strand:- start:11371 stop:12273 length:903 start_codon:yes stop_codon:yes gene_type:complete